MMQLSRCVYVSIGRRHSFGLSFSFHIFTQAIAIWRCQFYDARCSHTTKLVPGIAWRGEGFMRILALQWMSLNQWHISRTDIRTDQPPQHTFHLSSFVVTVGIKLQFLKHATQSFTHTHTNTSFIVVVPFLTMLLLPLFTGCVYGFWVLAIFECSRISFFFFADTFRCRFAFIIISIQVTIIDICRLLYLFQFATSLWSP